ncbi:hypothetical protein EAE96_011478 [Botrytis aclada]|nr:hypothetical protein EAE96_011478 [Botrytis aclada]
MSLGPNFLLDYSFYQIARKSLASLSSQKRGKLKFLAFILTLEPCLLLFGGVYKIGEVCADFALELSPKLFGVERKDLDSMDSDTKEESQNHIDKHTITNRTRSPPIPLSPFRFTKLRSKKLVRLPSPLISRIRKMIDSVARDFKPAERHRAVRLIIETEQRIEKLYWKSESNVSKMVEQLNGLERKLESIFENAKMTAVEIGVGDTDDVKDEGEEEEMDSNILTPSTSSDDWTPIQVPSTHWARPEHTFEDHAEDEEEDMSSGLLTPSTSSTPSISSSPPPPPPSSPNPIPTINGRPWWVLDDGPVDQKWN